MSQSLNVLHQPKPFYMIFSLEFWERFGFYGVQSILAVYFIHHFKFTEAKTDIVFGSFAALAYGLVALGGKIGDAWLGTKRTMIVGAIALGLGYFMLGLSNHVRVLFFIGLGVIAVGNSLFKANPSSLLSRCYKEKDPRLEGAFLMYYMAINIGSMASMLLVPYLAIKYNWTLGFYICAFGLVFCLLTYFLMHESVRNIGSRPDKESQSLIRLLITISGGAAIALIFAWLMMHIEIAHIIFYIAGIIALLLYVLETVRLKGIARMKMIVAITLIAEAFLFFVLYFQQPTSLNLFAIHNVKPYLLGIKIAPESFQSLEPIWIVILSPILAYFFNAMGYKQSNASMPLKFAIGMSFCAVAFLMLPVGIQTANAHGVISSDWMILFYGFFSMGELLVSGLGLAMISQLVPVDLRGFLMGIWFLGAAFAGIVSGYVAELMAIPAGHGDVVNPVQSLPIYSHVFMEIGITAAICAVLMFICAPFLNRLIRVRA